MHQFCIHCGHKNIYETQIPKFCSGCGDPFNKAASNVSRASQVIEDEDEDFEGPTNFDKESLARDWSVSSNQHGFKNTIGSLALNNPSPPTNNPPRPEAFKGLSTSKLLKEIQSECGRVTSSQDVTGGR